MGVAMQCLNGAIDSDQDTLNASFLGQCGGLSLAKLHFWRGRLFKKLLNGKAAIKDWTKALELNPSLAVARLDRLRLWSGLRMKTPMEAHDECVICLYLAHDDYSELEYYTKNLQATIQRVEIYGPRQVPDAVLSRVRSREGMRMAYENPDRDEDANFRKGIDIAIGTVPGRAIEQALDEYNLIHKTKAKRNYCLNCNKDDAHGGIELSKCGRCKRAYYCSKECIRAVSLRMMSALPLHSF